MPALQPTRVLDDLRELDRLTGGPGGARRVAWTAGWQAARVLLEERVAAIGLALERDAAGNAWAVLPGRRAETVVVGSHLDSVPSGGPLDGALGVFAALELLRTLAEAGTVPERSVALVDWADEEGARFGRSLLGSSAAAGTLDAAAVRGLSDADGVLLEDALAAHGVALDTAVAEAPRRLRDLCAYLELHIEQGPLLEAEGLPVAAVSGTVGIERVRLTFVGRSQHAGPTPMEHRRDAALAAAETALAVEQIAARNDGRGTTGRLRLEPGVATVVAGRAELDVDLRHAQAGRLAEMREQALDAARAAAAGRGCSVTDEEVWRVAPRRFDAGLVEAARAVCAAVGGRELPLVSGALHDAAEVALRVPAAMLFCPSRGGVSHAPDEATDEADLCVAVEVFGRLAVEVVGGAHVPARVAPSRTGEGAGHPRPQHAAVCEQEEW
jgi:hydantoinase/carbamoylase family amidase